MKTLLFLLLPILSLGQTIYQGTVVDKITKEIVPFATVGLIKANTGINANEAGSFTLLVTNNDNSDTLIISCIGYQTVKVPVNDLPFDSRFYLVKKENKLEEVVIAKRNYDKSITLNELSGCGNNYYGTMGYISQVAQHFQSPIENSMLSEIRICTSGEKCIFRVRVYDMDLKTGQPSNDLVDSVIEIKSGKRQVRLDVEAYKIHIPGKDFFVAVEWLKIHYNEHHYIASFMGEKKPQLNYWPLVGMNDLKNGSNEINREVWHQTYQGKWFNIFRNDFQFLISAKVKY